MSLPSVSHVLVPPRGTPHCEDHDSVPSSLKTSLQSLEEVDPVLVPSPTVALHLHWINLGGDCQ